MASQRRRRRPAARTSAPQAAQPPADTGRPAHDAFLILVRILARQAARDAFTRERSARATRDAEKDERP
jgi:hypothetical protein